MGSPVTEEVSGSSTGGHGVAEQVLVPEVLRRDEGPARQRVPRSEV
jgi:hypothetical protein